LPSHAIGENQAASPGRRSTVCGAAALLAADCCPGNPGLWRCRPGGRRPVGPLISLCQYRAGEVFRAELAGRSDVVSSVAVLAGHRQQRRAAARPFVMGCARGRLWLGPSGLAALSFGAGLRTCAGGHSCAVDCHKGRSEDVGRN
jgi:hypothetical protein